MKFTDLNFQPRGNYPDSGIAARHFYPNGYGVSIVQFTTPYGSGSYGADEGLYELAVNESLGSLLDIAGGFSQLANKTDIRFEEFIAGDVTSKRIDEDNFIDTHQSN